MMLLCLCSLVARPALVVNVAEESPSYTLLAGVVEKVAERSLLSRMGGEGVLSVTLSDLFETKPNALSATALFSYGQASLELCIRSEGKDAKHLVRSLEKRLSSMLLYDGLVLLEEKAPPVVDYAYTYGYASLSPLDTGEHFVGLDAEGNRWAAVQVLRSFGEEDPVSLLVGTSGNELLPGMRLERQAGKSVSLAFSGLLDASVSPRFGVEGLYSQEVGLYPFTLVLGGGLDFTGTALSGLFGQGGFSVSLPLSMVFGIHNGLWRNSTLAMRCTLGMGYSYSDAELLFGSNALFTYRYHLQDVGLDIGIGSKHWASELRTYSSGLFMQLGLAYTW